MPDLGKEFLRKGSDLKTQPHLNSEAYRESMQIIAHCCHTMSMINSRYVLAEEAPPSDE